MVGTDLTPALIQEGATLVGALDHMGEAPTAALWFLTPDIGAWKLLLSEGTVGTEGPRSVYRTIQRTLNKLRDQLSHLSLDDIKVVRDDHPMLKQLAGSVSIDPAMGGLRFRHNSVNGTLIEDAYIYRLKRAAAEESTRS